MNNFGPNAPNRYGETPIFRAASERHTKIVKILAPLTDNPNAPDVDGRTPIYWAALRGKTEIVKTWPLCQAILILQMILDILQFIRQHLMDIQKQKLSKSWPLCQTILMLQINMEELQLI